MANHEKKRILAADADDLRRLVNRATDSVYDFCLRISGDSRLARALTAQALSQALRGIPVTDPVTFFSAAVIVMTIAAIAIAIPSIRILRLNPVVALRSS